MQTWLEIEEFSKFVGLEISTIEAMIEEGKLTSKMEDEHCYIEVNHNAYAVIPSTQDTILNLYDAKEETLDALKGENILLKEALFSMQELYDEDRKIVETLRSQLQFVQDELEFTKRKYKMMWNKAVESYTPPSK